MSNEKKDQSTEKDDTTIKPDPETLHTTDPQEEMQGPISSMMQGAKDAFNSDETKEEADERKKED
jgi:hypothetical protein